MNPVKALEKHGQAVWLDFLARGFVAKGDLKKLIETDGVKGVTSNPSIFEKAIGSSDEYDEPIGKALKKGDRPVAELFEHLAIEDIQHAADVLRPVYDQLKGDDGFVSLEVSPYLAMDTKGTIAEAERLWKEVDRKNLMVKVPATPEGLPAIEHLIGEGISINITLLFSQKVYVQVAEAYLAGLEKYVAGGGDPSHVASVASFFVSRIDSAVDKQLDEKIAKANDPTEKARLQALKGKVAIANAKMAYQDYKKLFSGARWDKLAAKGAKPQRLLWASTGTKNKDYSDVLYVEELIGKNTINTVPPATLDAFRDHGKLRDSLEENIDDAKGVLAGLEKSGISLDAITADLVKDGVKLFADAADKLYGAVAHKRATVIAAGIDQQKLTLGATISKAVETSSEEWRASGRIRRLWQHDKSIWTGTDEDKWLGWLDSVSAEKEKLADYRDFASWVKSQGFTDAVVLGMGGSSLGPEVIAETFGQQPGFPKLHVLDSTDPAQVRAMAAAVNIAKTLFIVSSKSGGTTEPNVMKDYFFAQVSQADRWRQGRRAFRGGDRPRFVAGEGREGTGICPHFPWRSDHRRALFGAVAVRARACGRGGHRSCEGSRSVALDGAVVRTGRAAAGKPRRATRARDGRRRPGRPRQGHHPVVKEDRRLRRLGRTADRGIHRQGRQGADPDRRRAARRARRLRQGSFLHRPSHRR